MTEWYSEWRKGPHLTDSESSLPNMHKLKVVLIIMYTKK